MLNDSSYESLVDGFKGFLRGVGFKPDVVENLVKDNAPCDPQSVPVGEVSYKFSYTSSRPLRSYSTQEVAEIRAATPYISDIKLSKVKKPVAAKEPGNRRFQFEQEER